MKHYAYRVYKNTINSPLFGGTVSAVDMDSAVSRVITRCKIEVVHELESYSGRMNHSFMLDGQTVGILIYARQEDY